MGCHQKWRSGTQVSQLPPPYCLVQQPSLTWCPPEASGNTVFPNLWPDFLSLVCPAASAMHYGLYLQGILKVSALNGGEQL